MTVRTRVRPHLQSKPHWVYRLYDEDNELLYVGCTYLHPSRRIPVLRGENPRVGRSQIHHWVAHQYRNGIVAEFVEGLWIDLADPPLNGMRSGVAASEVADVESPIDTASGTFPLGSATRHGGMENVPSNLSTVEQGWEAPTERQSNVR